MNRETFIKSFHGFHPDTVQPLNIKSIPNDSIPDLDGYINIFGKGATSSPDKVISLSNQGKILSFEDPQEPDSPFAFSNSGYDLTYNQETDQYSFTIYPTYNVDFDFINKQNDEDKRNLLLKTLFLTPLITIKNNPDPDENPQVSIKISGNTNEIFSSNPDRNCLSSPNNTPVSYKEVDGRLKVLGSSALPLKISGPLEKMFMSFHTTIDLQKPSTALAVVLEDYARSAETDPPRKKDILNIAHATVHMEEVDPFKNTNF